MTRKNKPEFQIEKKTYLKQEKKICDLLKIILIIVIFTRLKMAYIISFKFGLFFP